MKPIYDEGIRYSNPYDPQKPIPFVKDCRLPMPTKENFADNYTLTCELTEQEAASYYSKFFKMGPANPDFEDLKMTEYNNAIDPSRAFMLEDYVKHMDVPGCCELRSGYCTLPNGVGFATATTTAPGVSAKVMSHYIENYNPPADLYYKAWFPGGHIRHYETMAVEDVGFGMVALNFIEGLTPEKVGLPVPAKQDEFCIGLTGANILCRPLHQPDAEPIYISELCYYRQMPDCYEERVTFWIGQHFVNGKTELHLPNGKPVDHMFSSALARHSLWETKTFMRNVLAFYEDRDQ